MSEIHMFTEVQEAIDYIESIRGSRKIITFLGFSGTGYEEASSVRQVIEQILEEYDPEKVVINAGATEEGIGMVYEIAHGRKFQTMGVVSTQAKVYEVPISPYLDHAIYIEDQRWGGILGKGKELSPTSQVMVEISDNIYAIGGGKIARAEYQAAQILRKQVQFISAEMNHQKAIDKAKNKGQGAPTDFRGALGVHENERK